MYLLVALYVRSVRPPPPSLPPPPSPPPPHVFSPVSGPRRAPCEEGKKKKTTLTQERLHYAKHETQTETDTFQLLFLLFFSPFHLSTK